MAKLQGHERYNIITDYLGTPLEVHGQSGPPVWSTELDSYGQVRHNTGEVMACPFRYQGQYEGAETGLYYNRFRYYHPQVG